MKTSKKENKMSAQWAERKRNNASKKGFERKKDKYISSKILIAMYA